jgi:beta-xylosidase
MIYVFENPNNDASIVYDESTLTEQEKLQGFAVQDLPLPKEIEGMRTVLKCKKETQEVWYDYAKTDDVIVKDAIDEYTMELIIEGVI